MGKQSIKNIFLTDENVHGPAIELARVWGAEIIRNVDVSIPCTIRDYDQCLFDYAIEHEYVIVTVNIKHFEPKFWKYAETGHDHPGMIFIRPEHRKSTEVIATWLALLSDTNLKNIPLRIPILE